MKKLFKRCTAILMMFVLLIALVACSSINVSDAPAVDASKAANAPAAEGNNDKKIVLQVFADVWCEIPDSVERLFDAYTAEHPNVTFELSADADVLQTMIATKNYPDLAVLVAYSPVQTVGEHLLDLTGEAGIWAEVNESSYSSITYEGKRVAVPLNSESFGLIYNKDLLEEAGFDAPPKTLSEFKMLCANLKVNGVTPLGFGFKEGWIVNQFINFPFHDEEMPLDEISEKLKSGEISLSDTAYYTEFKDFFDVCLENSEDVLETDYTSQVTLFAAGEVAMISNGDWVSAMVTEINPDINMGMMGYPYTEDEDDYYIYNNISNSIATFKDAKNTEAALEFIRWLVTSETGKAWIGRDWCVPGPVKNTNANLNPLSADGIAADEGGYSREWGTNYMPAGCVDEGVVNFQKYIMGEIDWQTYLDNFSAAIVEFSKQQ